MKFVMASTTLDLVELRIPILKERLMYILNSLVSQLEVAVCLSLFVDNDCNLLEPILKRKEINLIRDSNITQYSTRASRKKSKTHASVSKRPCGKSGTSMPRPTNDNFIVDTNSLSTKEPAVSRILNMLCKKTKVRSLVGGPPGLLGDISPGCKLILNCLRELRSCALFYLNLSPEAERIRDSNLRLAWYHNEKDIAILGILKTKLDRLRQKTTSSFETKQELIKTYQIKLARLKSKCKTDAKKIINDSVQHMYTESKDFEVKLIQLQDDIKMGGDKLAALLSINLKEEKDLRAKRSKVENQLAALMEKYDIDSTEKQNEFDEIQAAFEMEINEMNVLTEAYEEQKVDYHQLMAEKEEMYQEELNKKMYAFICNRSARRIQRYWRAYRERKLARKKKHKGKKGKGSGKT